MLGAPASANARSAALMASGLQCNNALRLMIKWEYDTLGTVMHGAAFQWLPSVGRSDAERTTYKLPCTLLKEAQLSSRTLSRPGMPPLATVPPDPSSRVSQWHRSSTPPIDGRCAGISDSPSTISHPVSHSPWVVW
jgi:hypothetical protein